ncbi:hypothetical protein KIH07_16810 [Hydrogenophaga taeniospiralis]|uniref:head-tail joining protein n=1 Tax=Hydrogenophaga taeniospiralis TaxID=65656 RepID=UPI001CFADF3D|nr:hypothetical protein [Hydrogenophaga taeniospiralis]MCB4365406.1 hypothetical protein [Hydrogenophaga taeniospiralis]
MPFVEDLTPFLQESEFSTTALIVTTNVEVQVIFDDGYETGLGGAFESSQPTALGATQDLQGLGHGSVLMLPSAVGSPTLVAFNVVNVQPDGTGMTRLLLERQP